MKLAIPAQIEPATELGRVHFIGIGGAGLSAIARLMAQQGIAVSGSDAQDSDVLRALVAEGIDARVGHEAERLDGVDTVIASTAVREDNPEVVEALRRGIRLWPRSAGLQSVLLGGRTIAVAGTHGKTTTTAMLTWALRGAGVDPSFAIGAEVPSLGTNAARGTSDVIAAEADESDGAFLVYTPHGVIVTNVDADHLDQWGTVEAYDAAFAEFVGHASAFAVLNADDPGALALAGSVPAGVEVLTAGFGADAQLRGSDLRVHSEGTSFIVRHGDGPEVAVALTVPGEHYAVDALLALGAGVLLGHDLEQLSDGLTSYTGAARRMQFLGEAGGIRVYDSYAHHPTEIQADLAAARAVAGDRRLVVAYQPHLVSRTRIHGRDMGRALSSADAVVVADIYVAREDPDPAVTSALVVDAVAGIPAWLGGPVGDLHEVLLQHLTPGDMLLTLGAGDITTVGPRVLSAMESA